MGRGVLLTAGSVVASALVVTGIGAGVLSSRAPSDAVPPSVPRPAVSVTRPVVSFDLPVVLALDKLASARAVPAPQHSGRVDMFSFPPAPPPPPVRIPRSVAITPAPTAQIAAAEPSSRLQLIGVAENRDETGLRRTAILTDGVDLWLVRPGEAVGLHHLVAEVSPHAATLKDRRTSALHRLILE